MDKRKALSILVVNSNIIDVDAKKDLLAKIEGLSDENVEKLGEFFAHEMKMRIEEDEDLKKQAAEILANIATE